MTKSWPTLPARPESAPKPPDRWAVERALKAADIPPIACHLALMLCTYLDADSTRLPYKFSPSITGLTRATGWSRRTVTRWLEWLECEGWLVRLRPTKEQQRKEHMRTAYSLLIPVDLGPEGPAARATAVPGLGTQRPLARAPATTELGPDGPGARAPGAHNQTYPDHQTEPDHDREEVELVVKILAERTGVTVDASHAARIRDLIVARPHKPGTRRIYLIRTLATDKNPERWLKEES